MKIDTQAARELSSHIGYLSGYGDEVRLWLYNMADRIDELESNDMKCHSETGKCRLNPKCENACSLRIQTVKFRPPTPMGMSDTDWLKLLEEARQAGWDECMQVWASHMEGMARAVKRLP